jgi:amino acid transporter
VAMRRAVTLLGKQSDLGETLGYTVKRRLLGPPLVNEQLADERLSKPIALGVLAPDGISSSAYGTEEILIELLKGGLGVTAFTLILPMTGVVLFVMALVVLSYREVVAVYTRAGGSYVVARENFGPRVAQVAAVALLIDYVVTVAVQVAAGTAAVASAIPALNNPDALKYISIGIVILMCYSNLRGIREAGQAFAIPTYLFSGIVIAMIVVGLTREVFGDLPLYHPHAGVVTGAPSHSGLIAFGMVFVLLRAFANGGSSLTGIEAVSNAVSAFKPPEGRNARKVLVTEGLILGTLVAGISWLAHVTHATPYGNGVPTVISQEARLVFGHSVFGQILYVAVQAATALILYTGGNTSFNGFPFLASFVAEDAFLPRWLTKRGHRLVFSNGIIVLAVLSSLLLLFAGASVNSLVPFYALGVFTAFTMAGFGMAKYHHGRREPGWRHKLVINFSAGVVTAIVVVIFIITKWSEGAWIVVLLFAVMVPVLIRLNREYRREARVLEGIGARRKIPDAPTYPRRTVFLFVDSFDLSTLAALRYARSLRPTNLRAVHFVIDSTQAAALRQDWVRANTGVVLDFIDCPDRRLTRAAAELVNSEASLPGVGVTAILPRRGYNPLLGRLLHDRTADKVAAVVSRIPHAVATIVPFDVRSRLDAIGERMASGDGKDGKDGKDGGKGKPKARPADGQADEAPLSLEERALPEDEREQARAGLAAEAHADRAEAEQAGEVPGGDGSGGDGTAGDGPAGDGTGGDGSPGSAAGDEARTADEALAAAAGDLPGVAAPDEAQEYERPEPPAGVRPIGSLSRPGRATVEGRIFAVEIRPVQLSSNVLAAELADSTGQVTALFYGRSHIPGLDCGARVRMRGQVGIRDGHAFMINPAYELIAPGPSDPARPDDGDDSPPRRRRRPGRP